MSGRLLLSADGRAMLLSGRGVLDNGSGNICCCGGMDYCGVVGGAVLRDGVPRSVYDPDWPDGRTPTSRYRCHRLAIWEGVEFAGRTITAGGGQPTRIMETVRRHNGVTPLETSKGSGALLDVEPHYYECVPLASYGPGQIPGTIRSLAEVWPGACEHWELDGSSGAGRILASVRCTSRIEQYTDPKVVLVPPGEGAVKALLYFEGEITTTAPPDPDTGGGL